MPISEPLLAAVAEAVFGYALEQSGLAERVRAVLKIDPKHKAFQVALALTYTAFARQYPDLVASLFDESFLKTKAAPLLAQLLTRRGRPDPAELARLWARHLGHDDPDTWPRLDEATRAAADFLTWLDAELAEEPAIQALYDSRALERIAENTEALQQTLTQKLEKALAETSRYVQVTGDVRHSVIVTGDHNMVTQIFHTYFGGDYTPLADLSLRDFLNGRVEVESFTPTDRALVGEMGERTREAHRHIADHYIRLAAGEWARLAEMDRGYGLRHLAEHLAGAAAWQRLHDLVAEGDEHQLWAEARHRAEGNYAGYLADLSLAWRHADAEGEHDPEAVGRQVRYALIEASIHSLAGNIPPKLLVALVREGL